MYPSKQKPYSGVFVKNQYEYLKTIIDVKDSISIFYLRRSYTNKIGSILKYLNTFLRFLPKIFKKYDVIHLHYFFPLIILVYFYKLFRPKTKAIITFHGSDIKEQMNSNFILKIFKFFSKKIDFTISVGEDLKKDIETKLNLKVDQILSAGVNSKVFYKEDNVIKKFDFIFVGSFIYRKGIDILIEAIKKINNKNISFCFVGSGPYENGIQALLSEYNIQLFKNKTQEELRTLYNQSNFFLFPSRDEPFGLVATESIFCGTPIIVSKVGGLKEQLQEGKTGYFATTLSDVVEIIKQTNKLNSKDYFELVKNTLHANREFELKAICNELLVLYKKLIN